MNAEFINALEYYLECKKDHDEARQKHVDAGGYSWEWYGHAWIDRLDEAREKFNAVFVSEVQRIIKDDKT